MASQRVNLPKGQSLQLVGRKLDFEVSWNLTTVGLDIDASAVCYDPYAILQDAVFFNNRNAFSGAILHKGDEKGSSTESVETVSIDLTKLTDSPVMAIVLTINSHDETTFRQVESARCTITDTDLKVEICSFALGACPENNANVIATIYRDPMGNWYIRNLDSPCNGRDWKSIEPQIKQELQFIIPLEMQAAGIPYDPNKQFNLAKDDNLQLPDIPSVVCGLGWDPNGSMDIDASAAMYNCKGDLTEFVWYSNKKDETKSVVLSGDSRLGWGKGDDEKITIHFANIPHDVTTVALGATIYTDKKTWGDVKNCYIRLFQEDTKKEICRHAPSFLSYGSGLVFCTLTRRTVGSRLWNFKVISQCQSGAQDANMLWATPNLGTGLKMSERKLASRTGLYKWKLEIVEGRNLAVKDSRGTSDPYVVVFQSNLDPKKPKIKEILKTPYISRTLNPTWKEKNTVTLGEAPSFHFKVYDHDTLSSDDPMGMGWVDLYRLGDSADLWVPLIPDPDHLKEEVKGDIRIRLTRL